MSDKRKRKYTKVYIVPDYEIGDLVYGKGYGGEVLQVNAITIQSLRYGDDDTLDEVILDCTIVSTGEVAIVEQHDATLVVEAEEAEGYIDKNIVKSDMSFYSGMPMHDFSGFIDLPINKPKKEVEDVPKQRHREREKAEISRREDYRKKVDELLSHYNELKARGLTEDANKLLAEIESRASVFKGGGVWEE